MDKKFDWALIAYFGFGLLTLIIITAAVALIINELSQIAPEDIGRFFGRISDGYNE